MAASGSWRTPGWWVKKGPLAWLLFPFSLPWLAIARLRPLFTVPQRVPAPVICVGNAVAGGAGKTPVALSLLKLLPAIGLQPHLIMRGYGGAAHAQPHEVKPHDTAETVGDEALLLVRHAPVWVSADRVAAARDAVAHGAKTIVMDDGWQSPHLHKDIHLLVLDGAYGVGNGFCIPAGPLREAWPQALARADAVALLGDDAHGLLANAKVPVFRGSLQPDEETVSQWKGKRVVAFAGIGRPEKFFATLDAIGVELVATHSFADHHPYSEAELNALETEAKQLGVPLLTTEKDWVRLPREWQRQVKYLPVQCVWDNPRAVTQWFAERLG